MQFWESTIRRNGIAHLQVGDKGVGKDGYKGGYKSYQKGGSKGSSNDFKGSARATSKREC